MFGNTSPVTTPTTLSATGTNTVAWKGIPDGRAATAASYVIAASVTMTADTFPDLATIKYSNGLMVGERVITSTTVKMYKQKVPFNANAWDNYVTLNLPAEYTQFGSSGYYYYEGHYRPRVANSNFTKVAFWAYKADSVTDVVVYDIALNTFTVAKSFAAHTDGTPITTQWSNAFMTWCGDELVLFTEPAAFYKLTSAPGTLGSTGMPGKDDPIFGGRYRSVIWNNQGGALNCTIVVDSYVGGGPNQGQPTTCFSRSFATNVNNLTTWSSTTFGDENGDLWWSSNTAATGSAYRSLSSVYQGAPFFTGTNNIMAVLSTAPEFKYLDAAASTGRQVRRKRVMRFINSNGTPSTFEAVLPYGAIWGEFDGGVRTPIDFVCYFAGWWIVKAGSVIKRTSIDISTTATVDADWVPLGTWTSTSYRTWTVDA